jgi:hypothetical protein
MMKKDDEITLLKNSRKEMLELKKLDDEYLADLEELNQTQGEQLKKIEFELFENRRVYLMLQREQEEKDQICTRLKNRIG